MPSRRWRAVRRCPGNPCRNPKPKESWSLLKALGDPVRLRLMSLGGVHQGGEACVCDLNDAFELSQPTISHHLKVLHEAGLLEREKRGVWVYYRARTDALVRPGGLDRGTGRADALVRRAVAEFAGTAFLVMAVVGSGVMASRLSPNHVGLQLLQQRRHRCRARGVDPGPAAGLGIIQSCGHFGEERALGILDTPTALALVAAQFAGGLAGTVLANLMFGLDADALHA